MKTAVAPVQGRDALTMEDKLFCEAVASGIPNGALDSEVQNFLSVQRDPKPTATGSMVRRSGAIINLIPKGNSKPLF